MQSDILTRHGDVIEEALAFFNTWMRAMASTTDNNDLRIQYSQKIYTAEQALKDVQHDVQVKDER